MRPRGAKRRKTHTLKQIQLRAKKAAVQPTKATEGKGAGEGGKEKGKLKANPKEATLQPKQRRLRRPRERETHTLGLALGKRKMEGVTKDLTDTAISSPITLEEKTPAPRTDV